MISSQTRDFVFRLAAIVAAVSIIAPILASCAAVFWFGDGEGLRILSNMTAPILGGLTTFLGTLAAVLGHSLINGSGPPPATGPAPTSSGL